MVIHLSTWLNITGTTVVRSDQSLSLSPGNVVEAEYVPEHPEAVGDVRQLFTVVMSVFSVVQVDRSHLLVSDLGRVEEAE